MHSLLIRFLLSQLLFEREDLIVKLTYFLFHVLHSVAEGSIITIHATVDMRLLIQLILKASVFSLNLRKALFSFLNDFSELSILVVRHHSANVSLIVVVKSNILKHPIQFTIVFN